MDSRKRIERPGWFHIDRRGGGWLGARIKELVRGEYGGQWLFGAKVSIVTFADRRSGSSGVRLDIGFGPWQREYYPLTWKNEPFRAVRMVSLREKLAVHETVDE